MSLNNQILNKIETLSIGEDLISIRKILFESVVAISCLLGLPAVVIGGLEVYLQGKWEVVFVYISAYIPVLLCFLFRKKISYRYRVWVVLVDLYILSILILAGVGLSGAGISLLITFCVLATTFLGIKMGLVSVLMSFFGILSIGSGMSMGVLPIDIVAMTNSTRIEAWVMASTLFLFIGSIMVVCPGILQNNLQRTIEIIQEKTLALQDSNNYLEKVLKDKERTEDALKKNEEKFRKIYNNILDVYFESSLDGVILEISPSIAKHSLYKREELIGKSFNELRATPEDRDLFRKTLIKNGFMKNCEIQFPDKDNSQHICLMNIEVIKDNNDNPIKFVGIVRDITERKQSEKDKIQAQQYAAKLDKLAFVGQIAGKMAHDFNNILGIIMSTAEITLMRSEHEKTNKALEIIVEETIRGKNLTKNLIAFAKDYEPNQEFFILKEKIDLVLKLLAKDLEGIELVRKDEPGLPELLADPEMIEHSLVNLIQNSIHALSMTADPKIIMRSFSIGDKIHLEIKDNGCGIPKGHLKNIYDPSFTLKGSKDITKSYKRGIKGTGYGMANVKKYIEQHKGKISVESEFGSGTKVILDLLVVKKELTPEEKKEILTPKTQFEQSILLVEDEQSLSDVQYQILTDSPLNHTVDIANNGQVAMDLFDMNEYDFVSLDYVLPGDITGMDVYNYIRKKNKTVPILFISGNIEFLESIKELKQGDSNLDHISKPCQNKDYVISINRLLEQTLTSQS